MRHCFYFCLCCSRLTEVPFSRSHSPDVKAELLKLSIPAFVGQAIDPLAQLMETAYIGRLGNSHKILCYLPTSPPPFYLLPLSFLNLEMLLSWFNYYFNLCLIFILFIFISSFLS